MPEKHPPHPVEILLVEDSPDDADLMEDPLLAGQLNVVIKKVEDGEAAIDYLRRRGEYRDVSLPDLILLDLHLPKKNGHEVLTELKNDAILKRIPVVILTSSQCRADYDEAWDRQANCCVPKPIDAGEFVDAVTAIERFWLTIARRARYPKRPPKPEK